MGLRVIVDDGTGVQYHYAMTAPSEKLLTEFAEGKWSEVVLVEEPPEIRRNFPMQLTIRRAG